MRSIAWILVLALTCGAAVQAAVDADEITSLPGWDGPLPSRMWSGYFEIPGSQGNKFYHYWFVESEGNPKTDPVALWLNGGPGSSSLIGLLTENGPFMLNDDSLPNPLEVCGCNIDQINTCQGLGMQCGCGVNGTKCTNDAFGTCTKTCPAPGGVPVPKLFHRTTGWQTAANYIFLESPAGVGFSYCDYSNCTNSDTSTAIDNHLVLKAFFAAFPEYASNDFYITGESYAGIYIPTLAEQIMNDPSNQINLKGLAVGNGCWGSAVGLCAFGADMYRIQAQFLLGVGAISKNLYKQISKACGDPALGPGTWPDPLSAPCQAMVNQMTDVAGDYEVYNYFDTCYGGSGIQENFETRMNRFRSGEAFGASDRLRSRRARSGLGGALNDYVCGGELAMSIWIALPEVAAALHVRTGKSGMSYGPRDRGDLRPLYKTLAQRYRVTIYSGDVDGCVPHVGTEEWTSQLGFPVAEDWRPWLAGTPEDVNAKVTAGYVTTYTSTPSSNFTFITIKGAGHMVPEFKPVSALAFIQRFFKNSGY